MVIEKLQRIIDIGYISAAFAHWDIRFFGVPKGYNDIIIVYDGTIRGMDGAGWAPPFFLLTSNTLTQLIESNTYRLDMDIGEMFLKFPLDPRVWKFCGVNLSGLIH